MADSFKGKIDIDIRDSVPDWTPYEAPRAPEGAPNVLYIVWDDVGFGAFETYGGLIETPNMQRIADQGLRFTQFHTTALCSPTRSCLLTGRNATSNGMAGITEISSGFPGSNGHIPFENAFVSEVLAERGWNTYAVGKWHVTPVEEANLASTKRSWPLGRGFERYYGFLGGETNQWYPDLVSDNHQIDPPYSPQEGYHLSKDLTDKALEFIRDSKAIAPEKPWLMYFCPGCAHAPHQVWKDWADKYKGKFDMGYEEYRRISLDRQKKLGVIPESVELPPLNPYADARSPDGKTWPLLDTVRPWGTLSEDEKKLFSRMAEVYAGFVSYTDSQIGRILDYLEESGQLENTLVVVVSDNGASGEGGPNGSVNENKVFNGIADSLEANLKQLGELGGENTYNHYPTGWAMAFNTPFKLWKRYSGYEGGTADPMIFAWPKGIKAKGGVRSQYTHAIDIVPTIYECLGIEPPTVVKGVSQRSIEGISFKYAFEDPKAATRKDTQFYTMLGSRGLWSGGWHACTIHPTISGWGHYSKDTWELFHLDEDRNQARDLAEKFPEKLEELKNLWFTEAGKYNGLPLDDRTALEIMNQSRPAATGIRERYIYYPNCSEVPESAAVSVIGRSYNILAQVLAEKDAQGVLFSHGGRFGGHSLYIKNNKLHYVYNWLGEEQHLTSNVNVPLGKCLLGMRFRLEGRDGAIPFGMAALYIDEKLVAEGKIKTQPGPFTLVGEGLAVGRDCGTPVSIDYQSPFTFRGGSIKDVVVDVSGERYRDLEKELAILLERE